MNVPPQASPEPARRRFGKQFPVERAHPGQIPRGVIGIDQPVVQAMSRIESR